MSASAAAPSARIASLSTWANILAAAAVQLVSLSIVRRGSTMLLPRGSAHFALESPSSFAFGYSGSSVNAALSTLGAFSTLLLMLCTFANFALIASNAFILAALTTLGLKATGLSSTTPAVAQLNLLPFAAAALHAVENVLFLIVVATGAHLGGLAGAIGFFRDIAGAASVAVVAGTLPVFLFEWSKSIGRDGRQQVKFQQKAQ
ncbi:hypothetical protein HDU87_004953 [Geranomyces variabilis]|uniref:Uncharacterized protein n=1 Tax=Geranomyces variabilis TaxID=109894 RepID=A0AAD5TIQ1_9FUNG|nr:hypothetical protein HDU87_004953 [Geranomyces variabilis]